jgi:long-subunit fatty acid transport protein
MKKIKVIIVALLIIPFALAGALAVGDVAGSTAGEFSKVGAAGGQFLKIGVGARGNAMGGAFCSVADDLSSIFWNPAGLAKIKTMAAEFSYNQWFATYNQNYGAFALPVGDNFCAALSANSLSSGNIPVTTIDRPDGTGSNYKVNDIAVGLSFAGYLTDRFSFGVTAKLVQNAFSSLSSTGIAFDVGTNFDTGIQGIKLGFSIHNLGSTQAYSGSDLMSSKKLFDAMNAAPLDASYVAYPYSLPIIFRAGISSDVYKDDENTVLAAFDFTTLTDTPEQFALGAEYVWDNLLSLRAGYLIGHDQMGLAGGVGVKYIGGGFGGRFDYSINPTKDLGVVNRLTIALNFGD